MDKGGQAFGHVKPNHILLNQYLPGASVNKTFTPVNDD
jgi:hypothetical protein